MRSFAIAALLGSASAMSPTDPSIIRAGDQPLCHVSAAGHTVVRYTNAFQKNFKCVHSGQTCSCIAHPTAAGDCKEFDHTDGTTKRLSNDAACVATTTTTTTTTPAYVPSGVNGALHVKYGGYCYITMDKCNVNLLHGACHTTCQSGYLSMPAGYSLVPYSDDIVNNVVKAGHFSTHVVVFSNGAGYGSRSYNNGVLWNNNMLTSSGNSHKTNSCSLKALMRKPC